MSRDDRPASAKKVDPLKTTDEDLCRLIGVGKSPLNLNDIFHTVQIAPSKLNLLIEAITRGLVSLGKHSDTEAIDKLREVHREIIGRKRKAENTKKPTVAKKRPSLENISIQSPEMAQDRENLDSDIEYQDDDIVDIHSTDYYMADPLDNPTKRTPPKALPPRPVKPTKEVEEKVLAFDPFTLKSQAGVIDLRRFLTRFNKLLEEWYMTNKTEMQNSVLLGKAFNDAVKKTRNEGYNFLKFKGFKINVNLNSNLISETDLTRSRFCGMVAAFLYKKYVNTGDDQGLQTSPLVLKVIFDENNPLTDYRYLLGSGFQYLHFLFGDTDSDKIIFLIGCALLDYLSVQSVNSERYNNCRGLTTFQNYAKSPELGNGDVFIAGVRNMKDTGLELLKKTENVTYFFESLSTVKVDLSLGGARARVKANWESVLKSM